MSYRGINLFERNLGLKSLSCDVTCGRWGLRVWNGALTRVSPRLAHQGVAVTFKEFLKTITGKSESIFLEKALQ